MMKNKIFIVFLLLIFTGCGKETTTPMNQTPSDNSESSICKIESDFKNWIDRFHANCSSSKSSELELSRYYQALKSLANADNIIEADFIILKTWSKSFSTITPEDLQCVQKLSCGD